MTRAACWMGLLAGLAMIGCGNEMTAADAATPVDGAPIACLDVSGVYSPTFVGCDLLGLASSDVTIDHGSSCSITLTSVANKQPAPVNGTVGIRPDGSFGPAELMVGSGEPISCTGRAVTASYEVTCGECVMTLTPPT